MSRVQHVDCVTFSTLSFFSKWNKRKRKIEREKERDRERERERKKEEEEEEEEKEEEGEEEGEAEEEGEREEDQLWKSLLQLWTLMTNLLKWTGPSHAPVLWKFVEKLFFNKGLPVVPHKAVAEVSKIGNL